MNLQKRNDEKTQSLHHHQRGVESGAPCGGGGGGGGGSGGGGSGSGGFGGGSGSKNVGFNGAGLKDGLLLYGTWSAPVWYRADNKKCPGERHIVKPRGFF